jgi:hypothetical protein
VSIPLDNHHELCHGDACGVWDCMSLPENVGQWREGFVVETNPVGEPDGSVEIEWSDGTRSVLRPRVRSVPMASPITDRYGEPIDGINRYGSEVIMSSGEIVDRTTAATYAEAGVQVVHRDGTYTKYHKDGSVTQHRADDSVYTRGN